MPIMKAGVVTALVIGLGRQFAVFTAWEPALGIFRRYAKKRLGGAVLAVGLIDAANAIGPPTRIAPFAIAK